MQNYLLSRAKFTLKFMIDDNDIVFTKNIHQRIIEVAAGLDGSVAWEQSIAQLFHLLPLYGDLGGCWALSPELEVIAIPDFSLQGMHVETDPFLRNMTLYQGSKKYPELGKLISKPADALECADCQGQGRHPINDIPGYENIICNCGGLGWLPRR